MNTAARESPLSTALATSVSIDFAKGGNSDLFAREGWGRSVRRHRWTSGVRSVLILPKIAPSRDFLLTLECAPLRLGGIIQELAVELNGKPLIRCQPDKGFYAISVPGDVVSDTGENLLVFLHPNALVPAEHTTHNRDTRRLAFAFRALGLAPRDMTLFREPGWLPELDVPLASLDATAIANEYQSLGQNCELGIFQRQCGIEPIGLLRFASIFPAELIHGLKTRFEGMGATSELSFIAPRPGEELIGRHAIYGLAYHTFKNENEVDVVDFTAKEARRLGYLARLLIEQIENAEKIFVRRGDFEAEGEILALFQLLRSFSSEVRLMLVQPAPPSSPEWIGRVEMLAPNLYRGYLSKFSDPDRVTTSLAYDDWLKVCATLYRFESQNGGAEARQRED